MLKAFLSKILEWLGFAPRQHQTSQTSEVSRTRQTPQSTSPVGQPRAPGPVPAQRLPKLYAREPLSISEQNKKDAEQYLYTSKAGKRIGPTPGQLTVVNSNSGAISVLAGAGSGKSTTLVSRVLFLHKILRVPLNNMAVFTFTRKSRKSFIENLVKEATRWEVELDEKGAERIVRTFHSKALQIIAPILKVNEKIFEFLGREREHNLTTDVKKKSEMDENASESMAEAVEMANDIEGFVELDESDEQAEILKDVYASCYASDERFRSAVSTLFDYTIQTEQLEVDEKYNEKIAYLSSMSARDASLCNHVEEKWAAQKLWPIPGIQTSAADGSRFTLNAAGKPFFANGYIPSWNMYVVLGRYDGIKNDDVLVGGKKFKPQYAVDDKRKILLTACDNKIRYVKSKRDALELTRQIALMNLPDSFSAPALDIRFPGNYKAKPIFSELYAFGMFAENLGLNPSTLLKQIPISALTKPEVAAMYATSIFYQTFYEKLEAENLTTFNLIFSKLGDGSAELAKIELSALIGMKHLMIDEFQDISPLIVKFVRGLHEELVKKSYVPNKPNILQKPSLMCVGDDWQSIYGWRGSSPHFLMHSFATDFPGANRSPILLQENFRSSQAIIDGGESFIRPVKMKSEKKGIASNPSVRSLPHKLLSVAKFGPADVASALTQLQKNASNEEKVYLLAATHEELEQFKQVNDDRLTKTTFHQSKGLEAEYVVLVGVAAVFGSNNLKNQLYKLANFPQSFDEAQRDEALRVAYVAATRAKKFCIWYAEPGGNSAVSTVPADGRIRQLIRAEEAQEYISRVFARPPVTTE